MLSASRYNLWMETPHSDSSQPWYVEAFRQTYLEVYSHRDATEAATAVQLCVDQLGLRPGNRVLDLCCGAGRHLEQFSRAGIQAVGLDLSGDLLAAARRGGVQSPLIRADMRRIPLAERSVDAVVNLFTSFGYFDEERENQQVLEQISRVLRPASGPNLLMDLINPDWVRATLVPESTEQRGEYQIRSTRRIDEERRRVIKRVEISGPKHRQDYLESVRLYSPEELDQMLGGAGLRVVKRLGALDGSGYQASESPRQILIAIKG